MIYQHKIESENRKPAGHNHQTPQPEPWATDSRFLPIRRSSRRISTSGLGLPPRQTIQGAEPIGVLSSDSFTESGVLLPMGHGPMTEFPAQQQKRRESPKCRMPFPRKLRLPCLIFLNPFDVTAGGAKRGRRIQDSRPSRGLMVLVRLIDT